MIYAYLRGPYNGLFERFEHVPQVALRVFDPGHGWRWGQYQLDRWNDDIGAPTLVWRWA